MSSAKEIRVAAIKATDANRIVKRLHFSGKTTQNSQLHFGVFLEDECLGAMQFGPCMNKRVMQPLVRGTAWNGFIELNRMAFSDALPRNSESRALSVAFRLMRKTYPHLDWVVSFADATQCGDGTIYRAAGFVLTSIKLNTSMLAMPNGTVVCTKTLNNFNYTGADGRSGNAWARENGASKLPGFQLRYLYFLNPAARARLTVPELPYSAIAEAGAGMYRGQKRVGGADSGTGGVQPSRDGASPISTLQNTDVSPEV